MKQYYYAIKDAVSKEFGPMFPAKNDGVAIRHYKTLVKGVDDPENYSLWCITSFDSESGQIDLYFELHEVKLEEKVEVIE